MGEIKTKLRISRLVKTLVFSLGFLAWGIWSFYDGVVGYPEQNEKYGYEDFKKIEERVAQAENDIEKEKIFTEWRESVREKHGEDVSEKVLSGDVFKNDADIMIQYIMGIGCSLIGIFSLIPALLGVGKKFSMSGDKFYGFVKTPFSIADIEAIDYSRWNKGIITLKMKDGFEKKKIVMDDEVYIGMEQMLEKIEEQRPELLSEKRKAYLEKSKQSQSTSDEAISENSEEDDSV